jgi:hypothetical protein
VLFVVDTGSTKSQLSEKEATLIGLDVSDLPDCRTNSVGFGGTFRNKLINCPVRLTFGKEKEKYTVHYDSGFRVVPIPLNLEHEEREKLLQQTPSVLGMDVLEKFKLYLDKRKVELTVAEE